MALPTDSVAPATSLAVITKSDGTPLSKPTRAIWVGTGGDLVVKAFEDSTAITLKNIPDGSLVPVSALYVMAATTAADLVAMF